MKFVVAIPSLGRAEKQDTLALMVGYGLTKEQIYIFVQTKEDYQSYQKFHGNKATIIYAEADNVAKARNNVLKYFSTKHNVLICDDDIRGFGKLYGEVLEPITEGTKFKQEIDKCFDFADKRGAQIFGIYPVYNDFFMRNSISTKVTVNTVLGFPKGNSLKMNPLFKTKEDIELCARLLSKGKEVIRFNYLSVNAKHRTNDGGCKEIWAGNENHKVAKLLEKMYPNVLKVKPNNKREVKVILKDFHLKMEE